MQKLPKMHGNCPPFKFASSSFGSLRPEDKRTNRTPTAALRLLCCTADTSLGSINPISVSFTANLLVLSANNIHGQVYQPFVRGD
jgi:hypothetical protein